MRALAHVSACLLALACVHARADDNDTISPDRPNFVNSSQTVGQNRFQLEGGLQWARERDPDAHLRTLTTPLTLRYGLGDAFELRLETDGRTIVHAVDPSGGAHSTVAGYADSALGFKWHIADQHGAVPSYGLIATVTPPSGSRALRGQGARPVAYLPAEWDFSHGWSLGVMPGIGVDHNDGGARFTYAVMAASLGKAFTPRLNGFLELALPQIAHGADGGTRAGVDTGATWLVNKDCAVDFIVQRGLNRATPDWSVGFGISFRR